MTALTQLVLKEIPTIFGQMIPSDEYRHVSSNGKTS